MDTTYNNKYVFDSKTRTALLIGMGVGVLSLLASFIGDDEYHTRFWTNFLHNSVFFTGIAFTAFFFHCAQITAFTGWNVVIKRVYEAFGLFMGVGLALTAVIVVGVWTNMINLYMWNLDGITDPASPIYDEIIAGKKGFLNPVFFTIGTLGFLGLWYFWAVSIRKNSIAQDTKETASLDYYKKERKWAASFLPIAGFLSTVFIWQLVMSIDTHWYSTMFAWYSTISLLLAALALMIMLLIYLKNTGFLPYLTRDHLHDMAKYMFGLSVFWMYLWFDQFMLIWYGNIGEETIYFRERMEHYPVLFWGNMLMNFVTPFFILMRNDTKRKFGTLFFTALIVFFGHWWDFFYMIKPGARIAAFEIKELSEKAQHSSLSHTAPLSALQRPEPKAVKAAYPIEGTQDHSAPAHGEQAAHSTEQHTAEPHGTEATHTAEPHAEADTTHGAGNDHQSEQAGEAAHHDEHGDAHATDAHATNAHGGHGDAHAEGGHHHGPDRSFKLGYTLPGFPEIGAFIGFLSLFLFVFFRNLERAPLLPAKDPYLEESLHHSTGAHIESEHEGEEGHDHH